MLEFKLASCTLNSMTLSSITSQLVLDFIQNECITAQFKYYESRGRTSDFRLQTSDLRLSSSEFDWDVGFLASAILIAVIIKIDEGVRRKLS